MSQVNLSNKIYELGEINYDKRTEDYKQKSESTIVASNILHEILETAMDLAITNNEPNMESKKMNIIDEFQEEYNENCSEIRDIIEGLSKINIGNFPNAEEPASLDVEMKRLLSEMMAPPFEIVNYDSLPRKDGVGDQPLEKNQPAEKEDAAENPDLTPSKAVEKKSRITDLVMNSKKVLNNLLDEEDRKKQEEWEESNEHVIQVIELQGKKQKKTKQSPEIRPENVPLPFDDDEGDLLPKPDEDAMEPVDLSAPPDCPSGGGDDALQAPLPEGEGDLERADEIPMSESKDKKNAAKKKKWNFNFKFFAFKKNRNKQTPSVQSTQEN